MRKSVAALYALISAVMIAAFLFYGPALENISRETLINKFAPFEVDKKILIVKGSMYLETYTALFDKIARTENSVIVMMPQVYNIKFDYYLNDMNPDVAKIAKESYAKLSDVLSSNERLIPLVYVSREGSKSHDPISQHMFSDKKPGGINPVRMNDAKANDSRMFLTSKAASFFFDYRSYPGEVPMIFSYDGKYFLSAPVEAVRKYFKLVKTAVTFRGGRMQVGDVMSVPVDKRGVMLIPPLSKQPETVTPGEFLSTSPALLENRIVIAGIKKSDDQSRSDALIDTTAAAISCILNSRALSGSAVIDIIAAVLLAALIALNFRSGPMPVTVTAVLSLAAVWAAAVWISRYALVTSPVMLSAVILFSLFTLVYFRSSISSLKKQKRLAVLKKHTDRKTALRMLRSNADLRLAASQRRAWLFNVMCTPEDTKKTFEKALVCLYNEKNDYLAVVNGDGSITAALFADNTQAQEAVNAALCLKETGHSVLLRDETVSVTLQDGSYMLSGGSREMLAGFMKIAGNAHVYVPGRDIQTYIGITKFQKAQAASEDFFAVTGQREEA